MNAELVKSLIIFLVVLNFVFSMVLKFLNHKSWSPEIPSELSAVYDKEKYLKARAYHGENFRLGMISSVFGFFILFTFLWLDGFAFVDDLARNYSDNPIIVGLIFFGLLGLASDVIRIPFDLYGTFVVEEKFGFNRTTPKTWMADKLKGYLFALILGGGILALVIWIYQQTGNYFWIISWCVMAVISVTSSFLYTTLFVPLFNKLSPLGEGSLKAKIESYCDQVKFRLERVFVMDGSKRSSRGNAFFSGMGKKKSIVLFDTLIEQHSEEELVAILAHETGHYKLKHVVKGLVAGLAQSFFVFLLLGIMLKSEVLSAALGSPLHSFHLALVSFAILFTPLSVLTGIFGNIMSRRHEFQADAYAKETYSGEHLANALIRLSRENLSNLTPHPLYVFINYSHPPVAERIRRLKSA